MSKLKNIEIITKILNDEHWTQTKKQFNIEEHKLEERQEGEIWEEKGKIWKIQNGVKISYKKTGKWSDIYQFKNCEKDICNKTQFNVTRYDMDTHRIHGCCLECFTKMQTRMILDGTWEKYEQDKIKERQLEFYNFKKKEFIEYYNDLKNNDVKFYNEDGSEEKWDIDSKERILENMKKEWHNFSIEFIKENKLENVYEEDAGAN